MLTRRDILRGMTGWSAVNAARIVVPGLFAAGMAGCCRSDKTLNLVLHGLYVMDITSNGVQLLTPHVDEHIYRAGNWDRQRYSDIKGSYTLMGVHKNRTIPIMNPDTNLVLSKKKLKFHVDPTPSYVTVNLPLPKEIHFLRFMKGTNLYRGIQGSGLALCTVLIYQVCEDERLQLSDSGWQPYFDAKNNVANLHLWAEPELRTTPGHARRAYRALEPLLPGLPPFEPIYDDTPPLDVEPRVTGLPIIQELGWSEWQSDGEGSRPTNCNTVGAIPE